jgi:hypothetical protein
MAKLPARKAIERSLIEVRTYEGKKSGRQYLLIKGHVRKSDFFQAFASVELKAAVLDIDGMDDTVANRKSINSAKRMGKIWSTTG